MRIALGTVYVHKVKKLKHVKTIVSDAIFISTYSKNKTKQKNFNEFIKDMILR